MSIWLLPLKLEELFRETLEDQIQKGWRHLGNFSINFFFVYENKFLNGIVFSVDLVFKEELNLMLKVSDF